MSTFVRNLCGGDLPPDFVARFAIQAEDHESVLCIGLLDIKEVGLGLVLGIRDGWIFDSGVDGSQYKDLVTPDNGR